MAQQHLNANG